MFYVVTCYFQKHLKFIVLMKKSVQKLSIIITFILHENICLKIVIFFTKYSKKFYFTLFRKFRIFTFSIYEVGCIDIWRKKRESKRKNYDDRIKKTSKIIRIKNKFVEPCLREYDQTRYRRCVCVCILNVYLKSFHFIDCELYLRLWFCITVYILTCCLFCMVAFL